MFSILRIFFSVALFLTVLWACDQQEPTPSADTSAVKAVTGEVGGPLRRAGASVNTGWEASAGRVLVLPAPDGGLIDGSLLRPEATELTVSDTTGISALLGDRRFDLFSRRGQVGRALLTVELAAGLNNDCRAWPIVRLSVEGGTVSAPWTAAFMAGKILPIPLDSIEGIPPRDSARLAVDLTRLAAALPDDTSETFRTLPLVVLHAWRAQNIDSGFVVATLVRRLNQEDDPREERLVVVVNTPSANPRTWSVAWHERASGLEEELVVAEPLLAYRTQESADVHLLFGRDDGFELGAAILTRITGEWRLLWESVLAGCD